MRCTRSESTEIPRCEPITSLGWFGSRSSCLVGKQTCPLFYVGMSAGSSTMRNRTRNDKYRFYPQTIAKILAMARAHKEISKYLLRILSYMSNFIVQLSPSEMWLEAHWKGKGKQSTSVLCIYVWGLGRIFYFVFEWIQNGYINY